MTTQPYTHTVMCFTDKQLRQHFTDIAAAVKYANKLLVQGHQAKIYPYQSPKKYVDYLAERGPS